MKKRLILRLLLTIILCLYAIRWNRELNITEVEENIFNLPEETPIAKEENLGYTLQSSWVKELFTLIKDADRENSFSQKKYGFHTFFRFKSLQEIQSQLPENILQSKYAKEELWKNKKLFTGSIEEYFSGLNFLALQEQVNNKWILPEIMSSIRFQNVYIDSYTDFPFYYTGAMLGSAGDQTFWKYLNMLALWNTHQWNYQKGFDALQASFLMWHKGSQNKSIIYSLIGATIKSNALQTLHYMLENYKFPQEILLNYEKLLAENQIDPEEVFSNAIKAEYQMTKAGIQYLDKLNKRELFDTVDFLNGKNYIEEIFALLFVKSKLFDTKETWKILNLYFKKVLTKEDSNDSFFKTFCKEREKSVVPNIFQRKNIAGISFLCSVLPSTKGYYENIQSIDAYQHYLHEHLLILCKNS